MQEDKRKEKSRARVLTGFWVRVLCFAVLALSALGYAAYALTPKNDYGICSMLQYYKQPRDSIDVLVVGTSIGYAGVNTNVLWEEYGIAAYDLCSAEQPFWITYYQLKEALKTQRPKVILLDAKPAIYTQDYSKKGRIILSTYGILSPENRIGAIKASLENQSKLRDYVLMFPVLHNRYKQDFEADMLAFPPDNGGRGENWKGFIEEDNVEQHNRPSFVWNSVKRNINAREEEYVRKIFELAHEENIPLFVVCLPNPDYNNDHMYMNYLWSIAEEYNVSGIDGEIGINYNDVNLRFGLRYSSCFADWQHLNVKGSIVFSKKLGQDLKDRYDLPDRRGDETYETWQAAADEWYARLSEFESSGVEASQ